MFPEAKIIVLRGRIILDIKTLNNETRQKSKTYSGTCFSHNSSKKSPKNRNSTYIKPTPNKHIFMVDKTS